MRTYDIRLSSVPLTAKRISESDAVLIVTDHSNIDYGHVVRHASLVVDTRNATQQVKNVRKVVKA